MNVLSLFDGMSIGRMDLEKAGILVNNYFASEIEKWPMSVALKHYPDIVQLGDVNNYKTWDLPEIDLLIGGSPCQDLSRIKGKDGQGLHGEKSKLFFKYVEALHRFKPKFFLLENVLMNQESNDTITAILGVNPIEINSGHFSAQDRPRLFWTNIQFDKELPINNLVFADVMETEVDEKYFLLDEFEKFNGIEKRLVGTLNRRYPNGKIKYTETTSRVYNPNFKMACLTGVSGGGQHKKVLDNGRPRMLTPLEYERLQNVPDHYTDIAPKTARYSMMGNGWTSGVIAHIFKGLM